MLLFNVCVAMVLKRCVPAVFYIKGFRLKGTLTLLGSSLALSMVACSTNLPKPAPLQSLDEQVTMQLVWRTTINNTASKAPVALNLVMDEEVLIVAGPDGRVIALNSVTGAIVWQTPSFGIITAGIGHHDDYLLVATQDGQLYALSRIDGVPIWQTSTTSEVLATPQVKGDRVAVHTADGRLTIRNLSNGKEVWSYTSRLPRLTLRGSSAPLIEDLVVYAGFANGKLVALDINTGDVIWQQSLGLAADQDIDRLVDVDSSLHLVNGVLYASSFQGDLMAVDALSGQVIWRQPADRIVSITVDKHHLYALTQKGTIQAYLSQTGEPIWQNEQLVHRGISSIRRQQNWLVLFDTLGYMHVLNARTGALGGRMYTQESYASVGTFISEDTLYVATNKGSVFKIILTNQ